MNLKTSQGLGLTPQRRFRIPGIGLGKGLAVTLRNLFRNPITTQYPEEKLQVSRRARGQELIWDPERCTGCGTCAKACPQGNIKIVTSVGEGNRYVVEKFESDEGRCIFCGLCVEACPYEALFLGRGYERSRYRRRELIVGKEEMAAPEKEKSAYARPKLYEKLPEQTLLIYRPHKLATLLKRKLTIQPPSRHSEPKAKNL